MLVTVSNKDNFNTWIEKTNSISELIGDLDNLNTTDKTDMISSVNELVSQYDDSLTAIVQDLNPSLGGDLNINTNNITGTGNINITGTLDITNIGGSSVGTTQLTTDESDKLATTEFANSKVIDGTPNVVVTGDISGSLNNLQVNPNVVGTDELDTSVSSSGNPLFVSTDGLGQIKFINNSDIGATGGGDISGDSATLDINQDVIGVNELNLVDGSVNHVAITDGSGGLTFRPTITVDTITPSNGDQTFLINYNIGQLVVYMNGIKLVNGIDFASTNGTQVVLTLPVSSNNTVIEFQRYGVQ